MYIVVIAWMYVVLMMSITESSLVAGVMTFVFFGLVPCALWLWLFGGVARIGARSRQKLAAAKSLDSVPNQQVHQPDRTDANTNERKLDQ